MSDQDQSVCMACSCPCEMHKVHNHPTEQSKVCPKCGHEHKPDQKCDCGCQ